ncbi:MAG: hypothetical protein KDE53_37565, partial [Caldilineaceae bacterium]|nr:hypothetical protein [Caldilineaceae bacterium]
TVDVDADNGAIDDTAARKAAILETAEALVEELPPYQPRTQTPPQYLAKDIEPTIDQPEGDPQAIIAAARSRAT